MAAWAIVAVPLLIMFFALGMERVEARLRQVVVGENDVEEFLEQARPNEVGELFRHGIGRALELFRRRRPGGAHDARSRAEAFAARTVPLAIAPNPAGRLPVDPNSDTMPIARLNVDAVTARRQRAS